MDDLRPLLLFGVTGTQTRDLQRDLVWAFAALALLWLAVALFVIVARRIYEVGGYDPGVARPSVRLDRVRSLVVLLLLAVSELVLDRPMLAPGKVRGGRPSTTLPTGDQPPPVT